MVFFFSFYYGFSEGLSCLFDVSANGLCNVFTSGGEERESSWEGERENDLCVLS